MSLSRSSHLEGKGKGRGRANKCVGGVLVRCHGRIWKKNSARGTRQAHKLIVVVEVEPFPLPWKGGTISISTATFDTNCGLKIKAATDPANIDKQMMAKIKRLRRHSTCKAVINSIISSFL